MNHPGRFLPDLLRMNVFKITFAENWIQLRKISYCIQMKKTTITAVFIILVITGLFPVHALATPGWQWVFAQSLNHQRWHKRCAGQPHHPLSGTGIRLRLLFFHNRSYFLFTFSKSVRRGSWYRPSRLRRQSHRSRR